MPTSYKILGQTLPTATTATDIYTVPASTSTVTSTLQVCNQANTAATFSVAARKAGATLNTAQYLTYNTAIAANDSISLTIGMCFATTDVLTVVSSSGNISFTLFGSELT
jgi:hypothetical protein